MVEKSFEFLVTAVCYGLAGLVIAASAALIFGIVKSVAEVTIEEWREQHDTK